MEYDDIIYTPPVGNEPLGRGDLLVASPLLRQPFFARSTVLLLDRDSRQGFIGLTLNNATDLRLDSLFPSWDDARRVTVYSGGPVEPDRLFMLHSVPELFGKGLEVLPGLFVGAGLDNIREYVEGGGEISGKLRFFLGYSGWHAGQLEDEISAHTWAVNRHPDGHNILRGRGISYWERAVKALGSDFGDWIRVPENPSLN